MGMVLLMIQTAPAMCHTIKKGVDETIIQIVYHQILVPEAKLYEDHDYP